MKVLLTGGAGYIGSCCIPTLLEAGHAVVVVDNLANGSAEAVSRAARLAGAQVPFVEADIRDEDGIAGILAGHSIDAVIHFAGLKSVSESLARPLEYWHNNVGGSASLLRAMDKAGVRNLVFSSSATLYAPSDAPVDEGSAIAPATPYGNTKLAIERMLRDLHRSDPRWHIAILRYFNPVGAHPSGDIGEDPHGPPNNLMPSLARAAFGAGPPLTVHGSDYPTSDGTCERDFVHVMDLAEGHVAAMRSLGELGCETCNLGTGSPHSVLELIAAFKRSTGLQVSFTAGPRRPGDMARSVADPKRAASVLGWVARRDLDEMCRDAWRWQQRNPGGYKRA